MAILVNMGQRGFVLKEGFLAPGKELIVEDETAKKLADMYKKELKLIHTEKIVAEEVKAPEVQKQEEAPKVEPTIEKPVAKRGRPKKVQQVQETK